MKNLFVVTGGSPGIRAQIVRLAAPAPGDHHYASNAEEAGVW